MKTILVTISCLMFSLQACNQSTSTEAAQTSSAAQLIKQIAKLEKQVLKDENVQKNASAAKQIVTLSEQLYKEYPTHADTPATLFKAGDIARGLRNPGKAIQLWGFIWRDYPTYEKAPDALFLQAFTFETMLNDQSRAKSYYEQFIEKFPTHKLVEQAQLSIQTLSKSPEDLIKEFEAKQKNQ